MGHRILQAKWQRANAKWAIIGRRKICKVIIKAFAVEVGVRMSLLG